MEKLIEKSLSGDENAYAKLIELIKYDLYKIARTRLSNSDDIEDAFQETIIKSYQNLSKLKNKSYFKTWITKILINECNNIHYYNNRDAHLFNKIQDKVKMSATIETPDKMINKFFVDELLDKLSDDEKTLAYLYFKENFTAERIAEILNTNKNTVKSRLHRMKLKLQKLAMLIVILCIITTTVVFAKEIIEYIISLFTTSRQAIDVAVQNDYVQNVDMDFVYDNDIGIKVDYVLIDNKTLDVSYVFDCRKSDEEISSIRILEHSITDENGNIIFSNNSEDITKISDNYGTNVMIDNNIIRTSNLYTAKNYFPLSNKLIFKIDLISITTNNTFNEIEGTWEFELNLEEKFLNRQTENYMASYSEYIKDISVDLDQTTLVIKINLNTLINDKIKLNLIFDKSNLLLVNSNNQNYTLISSAMYNAPENNNLGYIELKYDISKYFKNIDNLHLYVKFDTDKVIDIYLNK